MANDAALVFRAGPGAHADVRSNGFAPERIGTIAGASGGAKWLVLSQIDRVVTGTLLPRVRGPVHLIGSSIGAWRMACYAQNAPLDAIERFESAYLEQRYTADPDAEEISNKSREILGEMLGETGASEIVGHPDLRLHVMTVRCRFLTRTDVRPVLGAGLVTAAAANAISRRTLRAFFARGLFYDPRDVPPFFDVPGFPLERTRLDERNLEDAITASGSIPLVMQGVRNIHGAPAGTYRDGGIIDYHLDLPLGEPDRLTLYPHFFDRLIPGWFDKRLTWRRPDPRNMDRVIMVCPSDEFIASLPNRKIPDRTDFVTMSTELRMKVWRSVVDACRKLADELHDVLEKGQVAARLEPL